MFHASQIFSEGGSSAEKQGRFLNTVSWNPQRNPSIWHTIPVIHLIWQNYATVIATIMILIPLFGLIKPTNRQKAQYLDIQVFLCQPRLIGKKFFGLFYHDQCFIGSGPLALHPKCKSVPGEIPSKFTMSEMPNIWSLLCDANIKMY